MTADHPFQVLFESFGRTPVAHADSVNQHAYGELCRKLEVPLMQAGCCTLLRAPRAGHGKTHLLSRVRQRLEVTHDFILLRASGGYEVEAASVLEDVLRHVFNHSEGGAGVDGLARRLLALGLAPLIETGQVPSQDPVRALEALREHPLETLNFQHDGALTAHWLREHYEVLSLRLSAELAKECGLPAREIRFWLDLLFESTASSDGVMERQYRLEQAALHAGGGDAAVLIRLQALLGLMTLVRRVVLIADDLEGFSSDSSAALRFATFVMAMRQSVQRLEFILSLNQDVWDEVFVPCLSGGLVDRLSEHLVELQPLSESDALALLECRVPGVGESLLARIDRQRAGAHARGVIREAAAVWQQRVVAGDLRGSVGGLDHPSEAHAAGGDGVDEAVPNRLSLSDRHRVDAMLQQFREQFGQVRQ